MTVLEMAKKWYPKCWSVERLKVLVEASKMTPEEYKEVTGKDYSAQ